MKKRIEQLGEPSQELIEWREKVAKERKLVIEDKTVFEDNEVLEPIYRPDELPEKDQRALSKSDSQYAALMEGDGALIWEQEADISDAKRELRECQIDRDTATGAADKEAADRRLALAKTKVERLSAAAAGTAIGRPSNEKLTTKRDDMILEWLTANEVDKQNLNKSPGRGGGVKEGVKVRCKVAMREKPTIFPSDGAFDSAWERLAKHGEIGYKTDTK